MLPRHVVWIAAVLALIITPNVTGAAQPAASVQITSPLNGAVLDITQPVVISGTASAVLEGTVIVQVQDANGAVIAEVFTTAYLDNVGGTGPWSVTLSIQTASGTSGSLYAFSTSPRDGSIIAASRVYVQFGGAACVPRTGWPTYTVMRGDTLYNIAQRAGSSVTELTQANCLANPRHILVGQQLVVPRSPTPRDDTGPMIHIDSPSPESVLDLRQPVHISGTGRALFEGGLVVQAQDANGAILVELPVTLTGAEVGGAGSWSASLTIPAPGGTRGSLYAFSTSPRDGAIVAADRVAVQYEIGACFPRTEWPTYTVVRGDTLYSIARRYGSTVSAMTQANCLADPRRILVGQVLYVPAR